MIAEMAFSTPFKLEAFAKRLVVEENKSPIPPNASCLLEGV